jgi:hypothetical protein
MTIGTTVTFGYGAFGSPGACVTLGYSIGAALAQQAAIGWSGRPGANLRRKKSSAIQLPPGLAAANDDLAASNKEWDELKKQHARRMEIEAKRTGKVVKQAKAAEKAVGLEPSPAPKLTPAPVTPKKAKAPTIRPATKPATAKPARPQAAAVAAPAMPDFTALGLGHVAAVAFDAMTSYLAAHVAHHLHQQQQAQERARKEADARSRQEVARQKEIVREREAWQRRISTLTQRAHALSTRVQQRTARPRAH